METRWCGIAIFCCVVSCGRASGNNPSSSSRGGSDAAGDTSDTGGLSGANAGGRSGRGGDTGLGARAGAGGSAVGGSDARSQSGAAGSPDSSQRGSVVLDGTPLYTRAPRLTASQWEHAVTDILRFSQAHQLSQGFLRPPSGASDFVNNEKLLFVDSTNLLDFEAGAETAAAIATGSDAALAALSAGSDAEGFVRSLGRRALRRPLTPAEEVAYGAIFARGEELYGRGFAHGASLAIRALLESPYFLYRTELGPAGEALNGYELASKLSFLLLDTTPSDALLDAAAAGELDTAQGLERWATQMLEAPGALSVMRAFHRQLFALDGAGAIVKTGVREFDAALLPELDAASTAFFDHIFSADLGLREILTAKQAYVGPGLAPFYGLAAPANGIELRELGASRSGYFMQVPFLMQFARGAESAPSQRGFRLERLLCGPKPGPDIGTPTPAREDRTTREQVAELTATCGGSCHQAMDPLGFAFENFDGLGRERTADNGRPVDTTGNYPFADGARGFAGANDLVRIMAESMESHICYAKYVTSYALGRDVASADRPLLEGLGEVSRATSLRQVVLALVRDPAFRSRPQVAP